jgi:hypothetical protein
LQRQIQWDHIQLLILIIVYRTPGSGLALNNLKNKCQNFRKIFLSKNHFLHSEKENIGEYSQNEEYLQRIFQNN